MQNETINLKQHLAAIKEYWQPEIINRHGFQFRLVKLLGDYGWHTHGYSDKVLFAVEGDMAVDFADGGSMTIREGTSRSAGKKFIKDRFEKSAN